MPNERGQGMLEAIVAMGILVGAVAAALTLVQASVRASTEARESVVAANLAREATEVVRSLRDGNWLALRPFDDGLVGALGNATAVPVFDPTTGTWSLDFAAADTMADDSTVLYRYQDIAATGPTIAGLYRQFGAGETPDPDAAPTSFRRLITVNAICDTPGNVPPVAPTSPTSSMCPAGSTKVGMQVLVDIAWELPGRSRSLRVEYLLYDWRS